MVKKSKRLKTVRPADLVVGMQVLSGLLAINASPTLFVVKEINASIVLNDGDSIAMVLIENSVGQGGWECCWERKSAVGPLFHLQKGVA